MAFEVPDVIPEPLLVNEQETSPDVEFGGVTPSFMFDGGSFPDMNEFFFNSPAPSQQ